jgi:hypothetical protein
MKTRRAINGEIAVLTQQLIVVAEVAKAKFKGLIVDRSLIITAISPLMARRVFIYCSSHTEGQLCFKK